MAPPRILMCPPDYYGIEYEINPWMSLQVASDHGEAVGQWRALRDTLLEIGARVETLDPVAGLPDLVFTANAGLVFGDRFIVSRFRHRVRQGETPHFEAWARGRGFRMLGLPEGAHFEGAGDALFCGETLIAGYRFRSDVRSHQWVAAQLGVEVLPLELVDPRFYHLDTCFCPLSEREALYYPGAFDEYGRSVLKDRVASLIEVAADEAVTFTCNAVVLGRHVVLNEETPRLSRTLRESGYTVHPVRLTEFIKSGGSAKCLTLRLDGEDAAAWKRSVAIASPASDPDPVPVPA
jgi:N-dimethylarginine dimethylaminohydrolase